MNKGFTLIELLVTIAIIGILTSITFISFNDSISKADDSSIELGLVSLASVAELEVIEAGSISNNNYGAICQRIEDNIRGKLKKADKWGGGSGSALWCVGEIGEVCCESKGKNFILWGKINNPTTSSKPYFCIDSNDRGRISETAIISYNDFQC